MYTYMYKYMYKAMLRNWAVDWRSHRLVLADLPLRTLLEAAVFPRQRPVKTFLVTVVVTDHQIILLEVQLTRHSALL